MKKFFMAVTTAAVCAAVAFGAVGCGDKEGDAYTVYAPDGAPALALVSAIAENDTSFEYHVVDASTIVAHITGNAPDADFCVLPVNAASTQLGSAGTYQMLGIVTNGNLYFLSTGAEALTTDNFSTALIGKKLGVVQLTNVPGLTLQATLKDYDIGYTILENVNAEADGEKVNLVNLGTDASNVTPSYGCDYYLCPEPAASTKIKATASSPKPFQAAGDLQELYGGGYPQAVLVAKKSVIERDKAAVETLISYFAKSKTYLETVTPETVLSLLENKRTQELTPSFNANNLSETVIANCSVRFTPAKDCKAEVNSFLQKLIAVNPNAAKTVPDEFYYQ